MPPRVSQEMKNAQALLWTGMKPATAARESGISESSISKSTICREIIRAVHKATEVMQSDTKSSDEDLVDLFMNELCMPEHHAKFHITKRETLRAKIKPRRTRATA